MRQLKRWWKRYRFIHERRRMEWEEFTEGVSWLDYEPVRKLNHLGGVWD